MKKLLLILLLSSAVFAQNQVTVGFKFDGKIRPYIRAQISETHPNKVNQFRINETHHGYLGIGVLFVGILLKNDLIKVAGEILIIDDVLQHVLRIRTPVHMANDELWKYSWYRRLV